MREQPRAAAKHAGGGGNAPLRAQPPLTPLSRHPSLGRREYLTGFHKRKVARRKEALKHLEARQRVQRLEERAEVGWAAPRGRCTCYDNVPSALVTDTAKQQQAQY